MGNRREKLACVMLYKPHQNLEGWYLLRDIFGDDRYFGQKLEMFANISLCVSKETYEPVNSHMCSYFYGCIS
jgi:hypothetical protein